MPLVCRGKVCCARKFWTVDTFERPRLAYIEHSQIDHPVGAPAFGELYQTRRLTRRRGDDQLAADLMRHADAQEILAPARR